MARIPENYAGGQHYWPLEEGVRGDAEFSPCRRYRWSLERRWENNQVDRGTIFWLGMNPSTADLNHDDPTCRTEVNRSRKWGYTRYLKGNVFAWRATDPKDLPLRVDDATGGENNERVLEMARVFDLVVVAHGKLNQIRSRCASDLVRRIRDEAIDVWCLGLNADGSPRHPLGASRDLQLQRYLVPRP